MNKVLDALLAIDRRWIFLALFFVACWGVLCRDANDFAITASGTVKRAFDKVDALQPGDPILIALDYDPAGAPELDPMAVAVLKQAFAKKLRVVGLTLWPKGSDLARENMQRIAKEFGATERVDFCYLGLGAGEQAPIINIGQDLYSTFPKDHAGVPTRGQKVLQGIDKLIDFKYLFAVEAGDTHEYWIAYGHDRYGVPMSIGCTAVMAPDAYPYLQTKQIDGLVGGMAGGWEYEKLAAVPGQASNKVATQTVVHVFIVGLIVYCNCVYLLRRWTGARP